VTVEWVIQADDLTGAADSAVGFAAAGLPTVVVPWRGEVEGVPDAAVVAFDTASRDVDASVAADRAGAVARWFVDHCDDRAWMYKKLDSTLRGNIDAELAAIERELRPPRVVLAPAFPALGRTTVGGRQRWDGGEVDVAALLGRVVVDAAATEDLEALAGELEAEDERPLLVGSGGLAAAHAALRGSLPPSPPAETGPVLVISGSRTELAERQTRHLESSAHVTVLTGPAGPLARDAARALRDATPRLVIVVGGDTAHAFCEELGITELWAEREAAPGAPLLHATLPDGRRLRLVFKSGSFGDDDALARLVA
jgi:uncharacterized protein YgbK (DUF1537 family)